MAARRRRKQRRPPHEQPASAGRRRDRRDARAPCSRPGSRPGAVDYVNLHGTATPTNDAAEDLAVLQRIRRRAAVQFDQGRDRPYAGCGRRRRGGDLDAGAAAPGHPGRRQPAQAPDPALQLRLRGRSRGRRGCAWWPAIRSASAAAMPACCSGPPHEGSGAAARATASGRNGRPGDGGTGTRRGRCSPSRAAGSTRRTVLPAPQRLPPAERRRAGEIVKLSIAVAEQACAAAGARSGDARHGLQRIDRRRQQLPCAVRGACRRRPAGLADPLHQFGPQRRRRLLAHRDRIAGAVDQPVRVRRELRRRPARSGGAMRRRSAGRCCWSPPMSPIPSRCTACGRSPTPSAWRCCSRRSSGAAGHRRARTAARRRGDVVALR